MRTKHLFATLVVAVVAAASLGVAVALNAPEVADSVFDKLVGFSGFGFPKAHGAAFGLLAYQSTWLRVHYGPEFLCALLNEQPMGFYAPDTLVHELERSDKEIGLVTMCCGGGLGTGTLVQKV